MRAPPPMQFFDEVTSTQDVAKALLKNGAGAGDGTAVVARRQTQGRGRRGRQWAADHDGVWMSVIVYRPLPMAQAPRLGLVVAADLCRRLRAMGSPTFIKWPNDLLIQTAASITAPSAILGPFRKVAGLIVEVVDTAVVDGGYVVGACVVGVGVNLDAPVSDSDGADLVHAGGLRDIDGVGAIDAAALAVMIQDVVFGANVDDDAFAAARAVCVEFSATVGRRVSVDGVTGVAVGINDDGSLSVKDDDGVVVAVSAGDVAVDPNER